MNDKDIEARLAHLDEVQGMLLEGLELAQASEGVRMQEDMLRDATISTLMSFVQDLAKRCGISPEEFGRHYQLRLKWWRDFHLRNLEDINPRASANLDNRTPEEADVEGAYPPLFEE